MTADKQTLRLWIASALSGKSTFVLPNCTAAEILEAADDEGVTVLLARAMERVALTGCEAILQDTLGAAARSATAYELACQVEAGSVLSAMADSGLRALALKGTALAYWLYDAPAQRSRCDFDLLVEDRNIAKGAVDALQALGYQLVLQTVEDADGFEVALERRTPGGFVHSIDLHWRLMNHAALTRGFEFTELWNEAIKIPCLGPHARGLGRVDALAHALLHRVTNMPSGQHDRLIWLYDIHLLAGGLRAEEWLTLQRVCRERAFATPCLDGLRVSHKTFGTTIPHDVEFELTRLGRRDSWNLSSLDAGVLDRSHFAALPWSGRIVWLGRKLFPPVAFIRYRYNTQGWFALVRGYLGRWWVGIKRAVGKV